MIQGSFYKMAPEIFFYCWWAVLTNQAGGFRGLLGSVCPPHFPGPSLSFVSPTTILCRWDSHLYVYSQVCSEGVWGVDFEILYWSYLFQPLRTLSFVENASTSGFSWWFEGAHLSQGSRCPFISCCFLMSRSWYHADPDAAGAFVSIHLCVRFMGFGFLFSSCSACFDGGD